MLDPHRTADQDKRTGRERHRFTYGPDDEPPALTDGGRDSEAATS